MKGQIYHVDIIVSNLKKSVEFYDAFLGRTHSFNMDIIGSKWD